MNQQLLFVIGYNRLVNFSYKQKLFKSINFVKSLNFINKIIIGFDNLDNLFDFKKITKNYKEKKSFKKITNFEKNLVDPRSWKV